MIYSTKDLIGYYKADRLFYEGCQYWVKDRILRMRKNRTYDHYIKGKLQER